MSTLGAITDRIATRLIDELHTAVSRPSIKQAVNDAIRAYQQKALFFNEGHQVVQVGPGSNVIQLPSDALYLLLDGGMSILDAGLRYDVRRVQPWEADWNMSDARARPYWYALSGGAYTLCPWPDRPYDVLLRFVRAYNDFATDDTSNNASNDWTVNARNLIENEALSRLHGDIRQDDARAEYFSARAAQDLAALLERTNKEKATGTLSTEEPIYENPSL